MYSSEMMYELGKQRMQEFIEDAEKSRMVKHFTAKSRGFTVQTTTNPEVKCC